MNVSEEHKIAISGSSIKNLDIEPSIIVDGKSYTTSEFNKAIEMLKQPQLNENQKVVLEWLKEDESQSFKEAIGDFYFYVHHGYRISEAYEQLSEKEFAQVLEVFANWAQEQEEE